MKIATRPLSYLEPFAMKARCGDCAFTPGTEAHGCEPTQVTADLCVLSGEPFYCHRAGKDGAIEARTDGSGEPVLCRGFVEAFTAQGPVKEWQAAVASECLRVMEDAKAGHVVTPEQLRDRVLAAGDQAQP